jgi:hypothetical protein
VKKWEEDDDIINQMISGSNGTLWGKRLEQAGHYPLLRECLNVTGQNGLLIDLGCGAGDVSRVWMGDYLGIDLDWVIEKVAKVCNQANYLSANLSESIPQLPRSKCILMNAFLDVLENPIPVLNSVLDNADTEWVIVHRQKIGYEDGLTLGPSYGGAIIPASIISIDSLKLIMKRAISYELYHWDGDYHTIAMRLK